jgi:hypothetical protein
MTNGNTHSVEQLTHNNEDSQTFAPDQEGDVETMNDYDSQNLTLLFHPPSKADANENSTESRPGHDSKVDYYRQFIPNKTDDAVLESFNMLQDLKCEECGTQVNASQACYNYVIPDFTLCEKCYCEYGTIEAEDQDEEGDEESQSTEDEKKNTENKTVENNASSELPRPKRSNTSNCQRCSLRAGKV